MPAHNPAGVAAGRPDGFLGAPVFPVFPRIPVVKRSAKQPAGESIGLSIVKRLCDLLDASLEVTSPAGQSTMFKVVFPKKY